LSVWAGKSEYIGVFYMEGKNMLNIGSYEAEFIAALAGGKQLSGFQAGHKEFL